MAKPKAKKKPQLKKKKARVVKSPAKTGKVSKSEARKAVKAVKAKKRKSILSKKTKPTKGKITVGALLKASADYNPRVITERELNGLKNSYETYGDLSGVVLNTATNTLVSGHQRLKTVGDRKTKVVKEKHKDSFGTVAIGHIEVTTDDGSTYKIPYREVKWSDRKAEAAANIAANAGGGQFDNDKLGQLLEELDLEDEFTVETIGLDPLTIRQLTAKDSTSSGSKSSNGSSSSSSGTSGSAGGFQEFGEDDMDFENECPRCKFRF